MDSTPFLIYSFLSPHYFENVDRYEPSGEFAEIAERLLGSGWTLGRGGFWTGCAPDDWAGPEHGWKIHVSSTPENAPETLKTVVPLLAEAGIAFKFCADPSMLRMSLSKAWSRFQAGKFIAAYPRDVEEFKTVVERLHLATRHLVGPHVLTDRAYKDSKVVYYRYGAYTRHERIDSYGRSISGFELGDGSWYEDVRGPVYRLPPGYSDPFATAIPTGKTQATQAAGAVLLAGRYRIKSALKFNATGGIYAGVDEDTGDEVIVREVRGTLGHLESEMPQDPAYILKREARILQTLSPTGYVPKYVDLFKEWNHWFLVVERLDAISLWGHSMEFYFSDEYQTSGLGLDKILSTIEAVAQGLQAIHARGVVLRDLTRNNVMFTKMSGAVKFIDLEFAYELDGDGKWLNGWTPGYASVEQAAMLKPTREDDYYAFGVLILDMLTFCAAGLELGRDNIMDKLKLVLSDLGLPMQLHDIVTGLTQLDVAQRWDIARVLHHLKEIRPPSSDGVMFPTREQLLVIDAVTPELVRRVEEATRGLLGFMDSTLDLDRDDRLWPASPEIFITNPVSLQYGAAGVAWFLLRSRGLVDPRILDWIEEKSNSPQCPPGLYSGLGGVALLMLYAGRVGAAEALMRRIAGNPLTYENPGLYFGYAGLGLVHLHFWCRTGESGYLQAATKLGERLLAEARQEKGKTHWATGDVVYLGLGDGQSGIALFLTYLAAASGQDRFLSAAESALDFDIAHGTTIAGRSVWKTHTRAKEHSPNLPHARFGSAGVGAASIRYAALSGKQRFKEVALDCAHTIRTRISNKIWQDEGNSGYGEFLLDLALFVGDVRFRDLAFYQSESILIHALKRPEGVAFAGMDHYRICCDYSSGGAGIGIFFDRLLNERTRFLMLDNLLADSAARSQRLPSQKVEVAAV